METVLDKEEKFYQIGYNWLFFTVSIITVHNYHPVSFDAM
jgi:hypothetical protein